MLDTCRMEKDACKWVTAVPDDSLKVEKLL
jgi:hypothetical protein